MEVKFAPLNIPFQRRLQALSVAFFITTFAFGNLLFVAFGVYVAFCTKYGLVLATLYALWYYYDFETPWKGGRKWRILRYLPLWKYYLAYFPIRLIKTAELPADKNYLIGVFPHGVISLGVIGNFSSIWSDSVKVFPQIDFHPITLDIHFKTPLFRDYILNIGAIPASKECIGNIVSSEKKGNACVLIVGGAAEAMYAKPGPYRILLNKRKGFIRLALVKGCSLVPAFSFGEIDIYDQITAEPGSKLYRFQMWVKSKTGIVPIIPKGRGLFQYSFGYMPHRSPITTVVGSPIEVPKILNPSEEDVNHYHELFKNKLEELFEENKIKYIQNPETARLIFE